MGYGDICIGKSIGKITVETCVKQFECRPRMSLKKTVRGLQSRRDI